MANFFATPIDLGKLVVRSVIGDVFGNNLVRVTLDLFNYRQIKQSIASEKPDAFGNKVESVLPYTVEYDGPIKQRVFHLYDKEIIVVFNLTTYQPEFFMDAEIAKSIHEPMVKADKIQVSRGFSTRTVTA